jgi:signal transduction histidine kinase
MTFNNWTHADFLRLWLTLAMFFVLLAAFGVYVYSEKQIDYANNQRLLSHILADQLRQSSDDLTRMGRTYVVTGDLRYKKYYQEILDIRNGNKPEPEGYRYIYWDLVLGDRESPQIGNGESVALLEQMRRAGFSEDELRKLVEAKANSDDLTDIEFEAMKLVESIGPDTAAKRAKANMMMNDETYHRAKAAIMRPISDAYILMNRRTANSVSAAENNAAVSRVVFISCVLGALFILLRAYGANVRYITERKQAEKELQEKNAELERFTYTVSHDLKSPLISIQGFAGRILKQLERGDHASIQDGMKIIADAASKMTLLLNDLLELSKVGLLMNPPSEIDMNQMLKDVQAQLAGLLDKHHIELVVQTKFPTIKGDTLRLSSMLQNLIENAVKYMGDQAAPRIEIGTRWDGKESVFFVSDNGRGIEPRYHESIFGLFTKLDDDCEGTGIGLALVKRIVEGHGGRVWVESEGAGKGSRFCFTVGGAGDKKGITHADKQPEFATDTIG